MPTRRVAACGDDTLMINLEPRLCAAAVGEDRRTGTRLHQAALADAHLHAAGCWSMAGK